MSYSSGHPLRLIGGRLVLNFLNTADWSAAGEVVHEKLWSLNDLCVWARAVEIDAIVDQPIERFHQLRASLRAQTIAAIARPPEWSEISQMLRDTGSVTRPSLLGSIAISAGALLSDPGERKRIKLCPADDCGWLFVDETGNGKRHWCSMETCGNRMKARRNYARRRASQPATP